jgi:Alkylmercury lyase
MDERDLVLRNHVYRRLAELGRPPTFAETADEVGLSPERAEERLRRLDEAHWLVLESDRPEIRMANPFSAVPTPHRVEADGRFWYANCAWDAFGIPAALGVDGRGRCVNSRTRGGATASPRTGARARGRSRRPSSTA